jgi:hypothetical protein
MPLGDRDGTMHHEDTLRHEGTPQSPIAACQFAERRPSGTIPPETANTDPSGIYDTRGEPARQSTGPIEISSMANGSHGRAGRLHAHGSAQCEHGAIAQMGLRPINELVVQLRGLRSQRGQTRISRSWRRRPRPRRKYIMHEQIPTPRVGQSCGAIPSPQITPISGPFPGDCDTWAYVSGPLAGDIGRGPDTRAHGPGGTPPNSQGKSAHTRSVVGWVESGYVERGAHDTRHLSSCLVTPTSISGLIAGSCGG